MAWTRCDSIVRWGERQGERPRRERTPVHVDVGHPRRWEVNHALLFVGRLRTTRIPLVPWPRTSLAGVPAVPSRILPIPATVCFVHLPGPPSPDADGSLSRCASPPSLHASSIVVARERSQEISMAPFGSSLLSVRLNPGSTRSSTDETNRAEP